MTPSITSPPIVGTIDDRFIRGCSWYTRKGCRVAYRVTDSPVTRDSVNGFRTLLEGRRAR